MLVIGGGVGSVAKAICDEIPHACVDIIDLSPLARDNFIASERTEFILDDFLTYKFDLKYDAVLMRTLLHHLVGPSERETINMQMAALLKAKKLLSRDGAVFVTENFYQPILGSDITGRLIYEITRLQKVSGIVRKLGANTACEGVRFRSWESWGKMCEKQGLKRVGYTRSKNWGRSTPVWQNVALLCKKRFQSVIMLESA